ncbi:MAG: hypothetical protein WCJ21_03765, partial [Planctomycetota bacterium]
MNVNSHSAHQTQLNKHPSRRTLLVAGAALATTGWGRFGRAAAADDLLVGHASVDTTPPNGCELAGFHRAPGNPRLVTGSRQPTAARVIVLEKGPVRAAIVALDIIMVSADFARQFARAVEDRLGIPADHV